MGDIFSDAFEHPRCGRCNKAALRLEKDGDICDTCQAKDKERLKHPKHKTKRKKKLTES